MSTVRVNWCITKAAHAKIKLAIKVAAEQGFDLSEGAAASNAIEKVYGDQIEVLIERKKDRLREIAEIDTKLKEKGYTERVKV